MYLLAETHSRVRREPNFHDERQLQLPRKLYALNLNQAFAANSFISKDQLYSISVPSGALWDSEGGLFYDNTTLYLYAGIPASDTTASRRL